MELVRLVGRNLMRRKLRTFLTVGSLITAMFLLCTLRSTVTSMANASQAASTRRLIVQSAVSLFVDLPLAYEAKIEAVPGIERVVKWQWFGGYYKEPQNFFAQFAADPEKTFEAYPEMEIVAGTKEAFFANRRGCVIGERLVEQFGFKLGDTIPIIPTIFQHPSGPDVAWEFEVEAVYHPTQRYFDAGIMLFHWDYFEKTMESGPDGAPGVGTYILHLEEGVQPTEVMAAVDQLFENGPQVVQTTTEADFQEQFQSMMGNVPFFLTTIGGGVLAAILLAVVNTMLMAGREQTRDLGIMKALGFSDGAARLLLVSQSLALCALGGGLGLLLAYVTQPFIAKVMSGFTPGYNVEPRTFALGALIMIVLGLVAGIVPAWRAGNLRPVQALSAEQ